MLFEHVKIHLRCECEPFAAALCLSFAGGYTTAKAPVVGLLRQKSRPYLFSNTLAPAVAAASIRVFDLLTESHRLRDKLQDNTDYFRREMGAAGFSIRPGNHPIVVRHQHGAGAGGRFVHLLVLHAAKQHCLRIAWVYQAVRLLQVLHEKPSQLALLKCWADAGVSHVIDAMDPVHVHFIPVSHACQWLCDPGAYTMLNELNSPSFWMQ